MSENTPPRSFSVPGKVFILGEYLALIGGPAWVATIAPRFSMTAREGSGAFPFHPESPAGRLRARAAADLALTFHDPYVSGGFGASSAQFAMLWKAYSALGIELGEPWSLYRELSSRETLLPSGADLVAQIEGGAGEFTFTDGAPRYSRLPLHRFHWLVFSASGQKGRKIATHDHLAALGGRDFALKQASLLTELKGVIAEARDALSTEQAPALGYALSRYGDLLQAHGLEFEATTDDRQALRRLPGVLGIKGTGALQSDGIVILHDGQATDHLVAAAKSRDLVLIADSLSPQAGLQCEN